MKQIKNSFVVPLLLLAAASEASLTAQTGGTFTRTGDMTTRRWHHSATLLADGRVLIAGGVVGPYGILSVPLSSAELYDPRTGAFTPTGNQTFTGTRGAGILLPNGKVLVGTDLYDPNTGTFSGSGDPLGGVATLLHNGKVLIAGGGADGRSAEIYDPSMGAFTPTGNMNLPWVDTATLLPNGKVLIYRGNTDPYPNPPGVAELYDPETGQFTVVGPSAMNHSYAPAAVLLPNGKVLLAGGRIFSDDDGPSNAAELYDPASGTFSLTGSMIAPRELYTATLLPDGTVLFAGGEFSFLRRTAEIYDPVKGTFHSTGSMSTARQFHTATLLNDGTVLITGGENYTPGFTTFSSAEIYTPSGPITILNPGMLTSGSELGAYTSVQFVAGGGTGPFSWTATGLPEGITISSAGVLSGMPAWGSHGEYTPLFTVTDAGGAKASVGLSLVVTGPLAGAAPFLTSVSPNPFFVVSNKLFLNGGAFQNGTGLTLRLKWPNGSVDLQGAQVNFLSSTQLAATFNFSIASGNWTAQVINPDGQLSNVVFFSVSVPGTGPAARVALPQFVFGGAWYSALYFSNTTDSDATVQVLFMDDNGAPLNVPLAGIGSVSIQTVNLGAGGTVRLQALNGGASAQGWAEVVLPPGVTGYGVFRQVISGRANQEALVTFAPETSQTAELTYDETAFVTAVAFLNPSNQQVTVTITAFGPDGGQVGSAQVPLAPQSKQATVLTALPGLSGISGQEGRIILSVPNGAVALLGLRFGGEAFTSIPVTHR